MRKLDNIMLLKKIGLWIIFSAILLSLYFLGYIISSTYNTLNFLIGIIILVLLLFTILWILFLYGKIEKINILNLVYIWIMLLINSILSFLIGCTIPTMESAYRENMAYVMIPLLILLNYIIIMRLHLYINTDNNEKNEKSIKNIQIKGKKRPIIEYEGKKYQFSIISILLLALGAPLLAWLIYIFFDNVQNYWLHEIVVKQTAFFLNLLFNMNVNVVYNPAGVNHWGFDFPGTLSNINFETFCTGIQAICVFAGIIVFTPHSKDSNTKKDIIWRKTKSLIVSSFLFYVVNIIRMLIQLRLYYIGYRWEDIHYSISAASSFIAAIIVLLLHYWIPEFIISIIFVGTLISEPIKAKRKEKVILDLKNSNKVELTTLRKALGMKRKVFSKKFESMAKNYNFIIEQKYLVIPDERTDEFLRILDKKFDYGLK